MSLEPLNGYIPEIVNHFPLRARLAALPSLSGEATLGALVQKTSEVSVGSRVNNSTHLFFWFSAQYPSRSRSMRAVCFHSFSRPFFAAASKHFFKAAPASSLRLRRAQAQAR